MDFKPPRLRAQRDESPTPVDRPRLKLPPPPRGSKSAKQRPARPPVLGAASRATQLVDANELNSLLESDRRAVELGHQWFREGPSEAAVDDYSHRRRVAIVNGAATMAVGVVAMAVVLLLLAWS
jgi:hypothetical protein